MVYDVSRSADYGYISHAEYLRRMAEIIGSTPDEIEAIGKNRHIKNPTMMELVASLRKTHKTALLSNAGHDVLNNLFSVKEQADFFDTIVLSSEVGMIKPYPEIYDLTAAKLELRPEECIMIDDSVQNIEGAEMTGMKGLLYSSTEQVKVDVWRLLEAEGHYA
jgi:HAD superfamily hydrolase (TIGR01509 family)